MTVRFVGLAATALVLFAGAGMATGVFSPAQAQTQTAAPAADPNRLFPGSTLIVKERFSVEVVGMGPDLILVPGLMSSRRTWARTAERLRGHYRLHIVQVAGFAGETSRANAAGRVLAPTAEALDAYIVEAHLAPATYIGHSLGGTMGLYLAEHHPEHLKKVLLVDSLPFYSVIMMGPAATPEQVKPMADRMEAMLAQPGAQPEAQLDQMAAGMSASAEGQKEIVVASKASDRAVGGRAMADDMLLDLRPGLPAIKTPVTLIYPFDAKLGMPQAQWDGLYQSQFAPLGPKILVRVEDSRHFVMFDQPGKFDAALDAFLAR